MPVRTATPLMTTTLAIAAAVAAVLVGCSRHTATPAQVDQAAASGNTAYDDTTGQTVPASATPGSLRAGDATPASGGDTSGNAAGGVTQPGTLGAGSQNGAPSSSTPQSQ